LDTGPLSFRHGIFSERVVGLGAQFRNTLFPEEHRNVNAVLMGSLEPA
jgi:hypothetical protein